MPIIVAFMPVIEALNADYSGFHAGYRGFHAGYSGFRVAIIYFAGASYSLHRWGRTILPAAFFSKGVSRNSVKGTLL